MFYVTLIRNFDRFQYFDFVTNFLDHEHLFKKLEHCFLVESTKTESASFPYKTAMSETNVKINRMGSTKWTYHKERSFFIRKENRAIVLLQHGYHEKLYLH